MTTSEGAFASSDHDGKDPTMTNGNQSAHRARAAMGSLKKFFVRKPAKPADHYESWTAPGQPKATEPVGKDVTDAVDR